MELVHGINEVIERYTARHPGQRECLTYASVDDLLQENVHLSILRRSNKHGIAGDPIVLYHPPAWLACINVEPFNGTIAGHWLLLVALDTLGLLTQPADSILWTAFDAPDVQVTCTYSPLDGIMRLFMHIPMDISLQPETCYFMQHYVELHIPNTVLWSEEVDFDFQDACHNVALEEPRPAHGNPHIELTDVQCSTIEWLRSRLDEDGTLLSLFHAYATVRHRRLYYSHELQCVTARHLRLWSARKVLLADTMAGKDTAVTVYLRNRRQRHAVYMVVCSTAVVAAQWNRKLALQAVAARVVTYDDIQHPEFEWPRTHVLVLDSAVTFRHIIFTHINMSAHKHVIMLTSSPPDMRMAWRLLAPSDEVCARVWMRTLRGSHLADIWSTCVLTHEECVALQYPWQEHVLPLEQPLLYNRWRTENMAYMTSMLFPDGANSTEALISMIYRMQQGLLGYVAAPNVHYVFDAPTHHVSCSICLEADALMPVATTCNHTFCTVCLQQWLERTPTCPLCRGPVDRVNRLPVPVRALQKPRIPFVQKQRALRQLLLGVQKAIVISRHMDVVVSLTRQWHDHDTFFGADELMAFNGAVRGVWCLHVRDVEYNMDVTALVDLVVVLEPYPAQHTISQAINRMFTFALQPPVFTVLRCNVDVEAIIPAEARVTDMLAVLQN